MSGLFGGNSAPSASPVTSLRLQTSTRGRPIPLAYGKPRLAANLIWYGDLIATPHEQSNGGKGGHVGGTTSYTYVAALIMGLCEGAINAIPRIWRQKDVFSGAAAALQTRSQDEAYQVPASLVVTVVNAATFVANVYLERDSTDDGWTTRTSLIDGVDYTGAAGTYTFASYLFGQSVYITYDYTDASAPQDACSQLGLSVALGTYAQTQPGWMTTKHPTEALAYRGLGYVAASTYPLSNQADLDNHSFEIDTQFGYSSTIRDANPKDVLIDLLTNQFYGAGFPASKLGDSSLYSQFCVANNIFISPTYIEQTPAREMLTALMTITNAGVLYSEGKLKFVPFGDVAATANGITFTPNTTPVYDLTDDDFLGDSGGDPIKVTRKPNSDAYNSVRVKFYNRANNYNEEIVEAKDQAAIELYGLRAMDVMDVKELCDATAARSVAQLVLQRALYIRNSFEFSLGWSKALLEPMDLVTLTDSAMGMAKTPARILTIEEDEFGTLTVTAEEFPNGVCNAATYNTQPPIGYAANFNVAPGSANTPVIFEPPIELATSNDFLDLWIAAGSSGSNYGGCEVWLSLDNATYKRAGQINGKSRYGTLTAALALQGAPGIAAQTLSVALLAGGQLLSGTLLDATLLDTLCYVGGEIMAYQTATLTGASAYNLVTLNRGAYGSGQPAHAGGQDFVRIDDSIAKIALTADYIGKTVYVKLLAFNQFGGGYQSLADVSPTTYVVTGRFVKLAPPDMPTFTVAMKADGTRQFSFNAAGAPKDVMSGGGYRIKYRVAGSGVAWAAMTALHDGLVTQTPYETNNPPAGTYDFAIVEVDKMGNESLTPLFITAAVLGNEPVTYGAAVNMLANSDWQTSTGGNSGAASLYKWNFTNVNVSGTVTPGRNQQPYNIGRGGAYWGDSVDIGLNHYCDLNQSVPVVAGETYEYSVYVGSNNCPINVFLYWVNSAGQIIRNSTIAGLSGNEPVPTNLNGLAGYPLLWATSIAPDSAVSCLFTLRKFTTVTGSPNSSAFWNRAMLCIARPGVTKQTATPWIEAGVDNVHGGGIEALTVGTGQITANATTDLALLTSTGISIGKIGATYPTSNSQYTTLASYTFTPLVTGSVLVTFSSNNAYYSGGGMITYFDVPLARVYISGAVYNAADDVVPNSRTGDMIGGSSAGTANFFAKKILNVIAGVSTTIVFGMVARCQNSYSQVANDNNLHIEVIKK